MQGRIQDFKLGGGGAALKKIVPSGGRREIIWGISCEKSRFYAKKSYFFQFQGVARPPPPPPLVCHFSSFLSTLKGNNSCKTYNFIESNPEMCKWSITKCHTLSFSLKAC